MGSEARKVARAASQQSKARLVEQACTALAESQVTGNTIRYTHDNDELSFRICKSSELSSSEGVEVMSLLEANMKELYQQSSMGWDRKEKRMELFSKHSYFNLLQSSAGVLIAFANWRFDCEDCDEDDKMARAGEDVIEVAYLYDMQVCESHRGQKLGGILMNMLQAIATKSHMRKIMLTVFLANQGARRFYERLGYKSDLISPVLDNDGEDDTPADYDIMSIALN